MRAGGRGDRQAYIAASIQAGGYSTSRAASLENSALRATIEKACHRTFRWVVQMDVSDLMQARLAQAQANGGADSWRSWLNGPPMPTSRRY